MSVPEIHTELPYTILSPQTLKIWLQTPSTSLLFKFIIIDVRGSDFLYGKIPRAVNYPLKRFKDAETYQEILQKYPLSEGYRYIFHCMRSRNRGPKAALKFCEFLTAQVGISCEDVKDRVYLLEGGLKRWNEQYGDFLIEVL